jgi:plasmid stabilization system protein ParE
MVKINWTHLAIQDLEDIADYISNDSIRYAEITVHHSARLLSNSPLFEDLSE